MHDVLSIEDAELLALAPRPALALVVVFPTSPTYEADIAEQERGAIEYTKCGEQEDVMWYKTVALQGDSEVRANPEDEVDFHYVCFVKSHRNDHLYELDGNRKGPVDWGLLGQRLMTSSPRLPCRRFGLLFDG